MEELLFRFLLLRTHQSEAPKYEKSLVTPILH